MTNKTLVYRCWFEYKMYSVKSIDFNNKSVNLVGADVIAFQEGILMQFIGEYDNSVERKPIFEGDIVKCSDLIGVIEYGKGKFYIDWYNKDKRTWRSDIDVWLDLGNLVVIGNVYENFELFPKEEKRGD